MSTMPTLSNPFHALGRHTEKPFRRVYTGGKMNPVHTGHKRLATTLRDAPLFPKLGKNKAINALLGKFFKNKMQGFDEVVICPDANPPWKDPEDVAKFQDRWDMLQYTYQGEEKIKLSDINQKIYEEVKRQTGQDVPTRTVDMMRKLIPGFDTLYERTGERAYLAVGDDVLMKFDKWKEAKVVAENVTFVVAERDGEYPTEVDIEGELVKIHTLQLPFEPIEISSSSIIKKIRTGEPITGLVDSRAESIIHEGQLFLRDEDFARLGITKKKKTDKQIA